MRSGANASLVYATRVVGRRSVSCCALFALRLFGCQNGYPIPPTVCDEWCDKTQRISCVIDDPAGCVAACEKAGISRPACADLVQQTLSCLDDHPNGSYDCQISSGDLTPCVALESETAGCASTQGDQ